MASLSFESLVSSKDSSEDRLENYDIVKQFDGGVSQQVYLATCKRGRLRRRTVVLKKVPETEDILRSVAVHQALCHPTILSLFSTFSAVDSDVEGDRQPQTQFQGVPNAGTRYIVLEHCGPHGALSDHLSRLTNFASTFPLGVDRIRGVVKTLADALAYLEKENVVHRRLVPESVYITEDFRAKLGGFDSAIRISPGVGAPPIPKDDVEDSQHLAPEIKAGLRYDCSSDLWSLGILILWMLDPSDQSTSKTDPARAEGELGSLVSQLLEKTPEKRIKARNLCSHSFLDLQLPVRNLDPSPRPKERLNGPPQSVLRKTHELEAIRGGKEAPPRKPFGELTNRLRPPRKFEGDNASLTGYRGNFLDTPLAAGPSKLGLPSLRTAQENRRAISDPVYTAKERRKFLEPIEEVENEPPVSDERQIRGPRVRFRSKSVAAALPPFLRARGHTSATKGSDSSDAVEDPSLESSISILGMQEARESGKDADDGMNTEEFLEDFEEAFCSPQPSLTLGHAVHNGPMRRIKSVLDTLIPELHSTPAATRPVVHPGNGSSSPILLPPSESPCHPFDNPFSKGIGAPRPKPFNTSFLPPQTHKVARGQLVVLPSRTLLVDFREGERRQGRQGVEVLTISPDGDEVNVFSAPHMSSPCCLVEPSATYKLSLLPKPYWKLYTTAGKFIEQIKQHIPRLVLYESDSKFTLMANLPEADVETVFYSSKDRSGSRQGDSGGGLPDRANGSFMLRAVDMRIKIMRSRQLVEISRQVLAPARVHARATKPSPKASPMREKEGEWKKVVLVAPGGNIGAVDKTSLDDYEKRGLERTEIFLAVCRAVENGLDEAGEHPQNESSCSSASSSSALVCETLPVDQHEDIPRESEGIGLVRKLGYPKHSMSPTTSAPSMGWNKDRHGFPFEPPSLTRQPGNFETRFIPSVGWCVRYVGSSGGAGRYRMMFFDGKTLEVDVDEECVEWADSVQDEVVRYKIRECSSKREIMEKMCAFKEFVSMFDDDESGAE